MKGLRFVLGALVPASLLAGCSHMSNTEKGVAGGGLIGAGTGALVGNAVGHTGAGALIGAGVGALSGGLLGKAVDQAEERSDIKLAAATAAGAPAGPLGLTDVINMAQQHISDDVIISQIRSTGSVYHLSASDIIWLKQSGVSDCVVKEMQATATRVPRRVYSAAPVYGPTVYRPVYVVEPPPPPVSVGFGFGYGRCGRRW